MDVVRKLVVEKDLDKGPRVTLSTTEDLSSRLEARVAGRGANAIRTRYPFGLLGISYKTWDIGHEKQTYT